jgi:Protein of unknown function (DUF3465)
MQLNKFLILLLSLCIAACSSASNTATVAEVEQLEQTQVAAQSDNSAVIQAFKNKKSDIFVEGSGVVKKLLADDNKGSRHQKFLVSISPEQTLLFAHNIDLAPRIEAIQVGDSVQFRGEYVYNPKGGVLHWTHKDPQGGSKFGWIKHNGKVYE